MKHPKFGDRVLNTSAGEKNPHRISFFIRVVRHTGRMNPGTWYECTDGKGEVWQTDPRSIEILPELPAVEKGRPTIEQIKAFLDMPYWIEEISSSEYYFRTQDDCDGDMSDGLSLAFSQDGDAWVETTGRRNSSRFRTGIGGGRSLRVRAALMILALAIDMENKENPIASSVFPAPVEAENDKTYPRTEPVYDHTGRLVGRRINAEDNERAIRAAFEAHVEAVTCDKCHGFGTILFDEYAGLTVPCECTVESGRK